MHMVFDVKFDGRRKTRYVIGGNVTRAMETEEVYAPVVSIDFIRILFLIAVMNDLDVRMVDVSCAFLQSKCKEKLFTCAGEEWGPEMAGRILVLLKSVYGTKTAPQAWFEELSEALVTLGFTPSFAGNCVFIRRHGDIYEYLVAWVDDILVFSRRAAEIIASITALYNTKGESIPEYFLGGDVLSVKIGETKTFALSAKTYIQGLAPRIEKYVGSFQHHCFPMDPKYRPEVDTSTLLQGEDVTVYRMMIGSALWAVTLGRYDVQYATITLAKYNIAPREGHYKAAKRIIGYLKHYSKGRILIDPNEFEHPPEAEIPSGHASWYSHYPEAVELLPDNMPEPLMKPIQMTYFFDSSHGANELNRRSHAGILGFLQSTPHFSYSKELKTIETSSYGSETTTG